MRILVVEDEQMLAGLLADGLRRHAMAVDVAYDGAAALERLAVNDYDVLVLDRDLPEVHGDDVCRHVVDSGAPVRSQIADMAFLYGRVEIGVELVGTEQISIPGLEIVRVGPCNEDLAPATADQNTLAEHRNGAGPKDIVIYIVPRVRDNQGDINGCATHPVDKPGAVVAPHPRRWLHAHEVGHVLDLRHPEWRVDDHTTLMTGLGLIGVKNPPDINARDKATMFASLLTIP